MTCAGKYKVHFSILADETGVCSIPCLPRQERFPKVQSMAVTASLEKLFNFYEWDQLSVTVDDNYDIIISDVDLAYEHERILVVITTDNQARRHTQDQVIAHQYQTYEEAVKKAIDCLWQDEFRHAVSLMTDAVESTVDVFYDSRDDGKLNLITWHWLNIPHPDDIEIEGGYKLIENAGPPIKTPQQTYLVDNKTHVEALQELILIHAHDTLDSDVFSAIFYDSL